MWQALERTVFHRAAPKRIRYLDRIDYTRVGPPAAGVLANMAREFQVVPPVTLHLPSPELMAAVWGLVRATMIAGPTDRSRREIVATTVSSINACPYCVDVHASMLHGAGLHPLARHLLSGDLAAIDDPSAAQLVRWAAATRTPDAAALAKPPFTYEEAPHLVGAAFAFHYINRLVNVFLGDSPVPLPPGMRWARGPAVVAGFRARRPTDRELVEAVAWASYLAARRVSSWLVAPSRSETRHE